MTDAWEPIESYGSGDFFDPQHHVHAACILFRPLRVEEQVQTKYGPKDYLVADWHIFATLDDVRAAKPSEVLLGAKSGGAGIVRVGRNVLASAKREVFPVRVTSKDVGKGNPMWDLASPERDVATKVMEYWKNLQASEQQADAELDALLNEG